MEPACTRYLPHSAQAGRGSGRHVVALAALTKAAADIDRPAVAGHASRDFAYRVENMMIPAIATLLFVDDEHQVTDALMRMMRLQPFKLLGASSAASALEILKTQHVDVVVSDEQMPGMSGSVFLSHVRQQYPHTIRIILSGQASLESAVRAINDGEVYRFFLKPCNPTDLSFTIKQALAHKRLEQHSRRLLRAFQKQSALIEQVSPRSALTRLDTDDEGVILMDESDGEGDVDVLVEKMAAAMNESPR